MLFQVEKLFTNELEKGDRKKAMNRLKVPPFGIQKTDWTTLLVGFSGGCFFILLAALIASGFVMNERKIPHTGTELGNISSGNR